MEKARDVCGSKARDGQGSTSTKNGEVVHVCVVKPREEERVRGECRQGMCVGVGQGMCVLGSKGCVCWDRHQGRKSAKGRNDE